MAEPIKLEVGKAYRTREGRMVEIEDTGCHPDFPLMGRHQNGAWCSYNEFGENHLDERYDIVAEWTDEPAELKIDWGGELQISDPNDPEDGWDDVTVVWHDAEQAIGWLSCDEPKHAMYWPFAEWQFRNKPPEPKRVKGWVNIYGQPGRFSISVIHPDKTTARSLRDRDAFACIEIDVPEGHGLTD